MHFKVSWLILLLSFCKQLTTLGQTPDSAINANVRIWKKYADQRKPDLFLHLDKSLYTPHENILFTAYLLDKGSDTATPHILHIVLVDLAARKPISSDRFLMSEGISSGALSIPDTLENGQYLLTAYTNAMRDEPAGLFFRQEITIRSNEKPAFSLAVAPSPNGASKMDSIRLTCKIGTDYGGLASGGNFSYTIFGDGQLLQSGKRIIDPFGETSITLPMEDTLLHSIILNTEIKRGGKTGHARKSLILTPGQVMIQFYPEGGHLIDGHTARMGIEVRKKDGMGISTRGVLVENGQGIVHFQTDKYGLSVIDCTLHKGKTYEIRLADLPPETYTCSQFPDILPEGLSLHMINGVVRDSLALTIEGPATGSNCTLMIYSQQALLYTARIGLNAGGGSLTIPTKDWPAGLAEIALFTGKDVPAAKRAIYLPPPGISVAIQTDSSLYHSRSKVRIHVKLANEQGNGVKGLFSVASVLSTRANAASLQDIRRHANFDHYLQSGEVTIPNPDYFNNDSSIDAVLLTRFGKRHSWQDIKEDTAGKGKSMAGEDDYGHVRLNTGNSLRKPVSLLVMGPSLYKFETDSSGNFQIPYQALIAPLGVNPIVSVIDNTNQGDYNIVIQNHSDTVNQQLATAWYSPPIMMMDTAIREEEENSPGFNSPKTLKAAVVRSGATNSIDYQKSGSCPDWVCFNDVLNCPYHPTGRKPAKGESYTYIDRKMGQSTRTSTIIYRGCVSCKSCDYPPFTGNVRAVHLAPEFYKSDSANFSPSEPARYSTLYWDPVIVTDKNGEADFNFYTDDLTGRFYTILQGMSAAGSFSGISSFKVVP